MEASADGPLTPEHHQQLLEANQRARKIHTAAGVAAFNGWVTGAIAVLSAPFAPFSIAGSLVTIGTAVVAYNEFRGRRMLLSFKPRGAALLGWNQVGLLGLIVGYCLWMIVAGLVGPSPYESELQAYPELKSVLGSPEQLRRLTQTLVLAVYGSVIGLSGIFQGLNAVYYFTRRKHIDAYLQKTPPWVVTLQRSTSVAR